MKIEIKTTKNKLIVTIPINGKEVVFKEENKDEVKINVIPQETTTGNSVVSPQQTDGNTEVQQ